MLDILESFVCFFARSELDFACLELTLRFLIDLESFVCFFHYLQDAALLELASNFCMASTSHRIYRNAFSFQLWDGSTNLE